MIDFKDITYLKCGNEKQKSAYQTLSGHQVLKKLEVFSPILTGTIPIEINIKGSDLDIICCWQNINEFITQLENNFSEEKNFNLRVEIFNGQKSVIANFWIDEFEIEIFGQNIATTAQQAYRHLLIEHLILQEKGDHFRQQIIQLKKEGFKTEPALQNY